MHHGDLRHGGLYVPVSPHRFEQLSAQQWRVLRNDRPVHCALPLHLPVIATAATVAAAGVAICLAVATAISLALSAAISIPITAAFFIALPAAIGIPIAATFASAAHGVHGLNR